MPVLQINAVKDRPVLSGAMTLGKSLDHHIAALPSDAPVIVLVHGYKFSPFDQRRDPHENILSMAPKSRLGVISWPRHLGFGRGRAEEGLCIGFGWKARGTFWQAYGEAELAGAALADLIARIADRTDRKVHLVAHSLGARVALAGIAAAPAGAVGRCILMAAAEFQAPALRCLEKPAGQRVEIVNITSRENDIFDVMVETADPPAWRRAGIGGRIAPGGRQLAGFADRPRTDPYRPCRTWPPHRGTRAAHLPLVGVSAPRIVRVLRGPAAPARGLADAASENAAAGSGRCTLVAAFLATGGSGPLALPAESLILASDKEVFMTQPIDLYYWPTPNGWKIAIALAEMEPAL